MKNFLKAKFIGSIFAGILTLLSILFTVISFDCGFIVSGIYLMLCTLTFGYNTYVLFMNWKKRI